MSSGRLLSSPKVSKETNVQLLATRADYGPMDLGSDIEARLGTIFTIVKRVEEDRQEER